MTYQLCTNNTYHHIEVLMKMMSNFPFQIPAHYIIRYGAELVNRTISGKDNTHENGRTERDGRIGRKAR